MEDNFTQMASIWLNKFINDLAKDKDQVLAKLETFKGGDPEIVRQAIENGPDTLDQKDPAICETLFHFVEYYATGKFSSIAVGVVSDVKQV